MAIFVKSSIYNKRIETCKQCPYFNAETRSCGTLVTGDEVIVDGEVKRTCGCFMPVKAKLAFLACPLGKWSAMLSKRDIVRLKRLIERIDSTKQIVDADRNELYQLYKQALDTTVENTTCAPCVRKWYNELKETLQQYQQGAEK